MIRAMMIAAALALTSASAFSASAPGLAGSWVALEIDGEQVIGNGPQLVISDGESHYGDGGCNSYTATIDFADLNAIKVTSVAADDRNFLCSPDQATQQDDYFATLRAVTSGEVNKDGLLLKTAKNTTIRFRRADAR